MTAVVSSPQRDELVLGWNNKQQRGNKCDLITYQDVIGPPFPGEVERRLLQLHHVLVSAVGPMLGTRLSCVGPKQRGTLSTLQHIVALAFHSLMPNVIRLNGLNMLEPLYNQLKKQLGRQLGKEISSQNV